MAPWCVLRVCVCVRACVCVCVLAYGVRSATPLANWSQPRRCMCPCMHVGLHPTLQAVHPQLPTLHYPTHAL